MSPSLAGRFFTTEPSQKPDPMHTDSKTGMEKENVSQVSRSAPVPGRARGGQPQGQAEFGLKKLTKEAAPGFLTSAPDLATTPAGEWALCRSSRPRNGLGCSTSAGEGILNSLP